MGGYPNRSQLSEWIPLKGYGQKKGAPGSDPGHPLLRVSGNLYRIREAVPWVVNPSLSLFWMPTVASSTTCTSVNY